MFFSLIISSCKQKENVQILNKDLMLYVKRFIEEIDKSKYCKTKYITIEIKHDKIYISNYKPTLRKDFLGCMEFEKSNLYFYSSDEYSNFITINNNNFKSIENNYSNECEPPKDKILLIDKKNGNVLKPLKLNLMNLNHNK
jgi:hypothetical protein